ncbi:MAG TPA: PaaI family thioesterase [Acidimicrobiia bacterium]|nr:PaaI family thioesterase [Acidimicrobiia bacterium]
MSEAAPGIPDSPAFATPERAELAAAIRSLIDTVMSVEEVDAATLHTVAQEVDQLTFRLGRGREEGAGYRPRSHGDYLPRSPIVGEASPLSPRLDWEVFTRADGSPGVEARGTFGAAYEGPPSFVHGGWVACAFDEVLGIANIVSGNPGMTARLIVHYRKPTPLFRELRLRAWVDRVEGRRVMSRAEMYDGDTLTAEAEGLFVQPRPEVAEQYFGPRPD